MDAAAAKKKADDIQATLTEKTTQLKAAEDDAAKKAADEKAKFDKYEDLRVHWEPYGGGYVPKTAIAKADWQAAKAAAEDAAKALDAAKASLADVQGQAAVLKSQADEAEKKAQEAAAAAKKKAEGEVAASTKTNAAIVADEGIADHDAAPKEEADAPHGQQAPTQRDASTENKASAETPDTRAHEELTAAETPSATTESDKSEDPLKITDPSDASPERPARRDTPGDPRTVLSQHVPDVQDPDAAPSSTSHASISTEITPQTDDKPSGSTKASGADGKAQGGETPAKMNESATSDESAKTKGTRESESAPEKSSGRDAA
ncbi:hypothetical protein [Mycolicibacterium madagascariense]|uniref:hypothetical protein n=1 Tax=Mycolicibacterium madagascariense TaxID=212765 RepID=UPI0021F37FB3|nr:hypothetical protein [Mycolicibacterium madagascariense]MCV7013348.1 hypothetical protein [Mycolicibacterium madagascariense]